MHNNEACHVRIIIPRDPLFGLQPQVDRQVQAKKWD